MKKLLLAITILILASGTLHGQVAGKSIGARIAGGAGEIVFQLPLNESRRLEIDLDPYDFTFRNIDIICIWQSVYPVSGVPGLNWYAGGGARIGFYDTFKSFGSGIVGNIGIELNIGQAPVAFSLDWRPSLSYRFLTGKLYISYAYFGFGIRYRF